MSPRICVFDRNWNCLYDNAVDGRTLDEFIQGVPAARSVIDERPIYHVTVDEQAERVRGRLVPRRG